MTFCGIFSLPTVNLEVFLSTGSEVDAYTNYGVIGVVEIIASWRG